MAGRVDELDPLSYFEEWPSLRSASGRVDVHSLVAFWVKESRLEGDYYEFGVGQGRSAVAAIRAAAKCGQRYAFHLFDSFEGLPELKGVDRDSRQFHQGQFSYSPDHVMAFLKEHCPAIGEDVHLHKAWFADLPLLSRAPSSPAAIVHVDCDLYQSTLDVLRYVTGKIQNGTVILFDDFNAFSASAFHGQRLAVANWMEEIRSAKQAGKRRCGLRLTEYVSYGWHGKGFVCHWE